MAKQRRQANGVRVNNAGAPYAVEGRGLAATPATAIGGGRGAQNNNVVPGAGVTNNGGRGAQNNTPTPPEGTQGAQPNADPAGVGALAKPLELPTIDAASAENARRLSVLKQRARGGRASTILSQPNY